ncbi:DUF4870 domain-containing protein [Arcanobacterium pinnipediorum]|uniref:DUF4870 domain-containing protein n=1 Tax=Arcanobacterium pinnipediorum TaxID=1503041 RepID=A0ABY5AI89_9ACTO|nr:DUF4870 domain-containing protein [Arcanobacterium pinnipediorum]USR79156.1 DUF4870 domain-containing protein [Arcanobacterium pinnipediorum]
MTESFYRNGRIIESVTEDERTWAKIAHLSAIIAMIVSATSLSFLGPLVIWAMKKDSSPFVRQAAAQSFNFNAGMWIMNIVGWALTITIILAPIGLPLVFASFVLTIWQHLKAFGATNRGEQYSYPFQIPILS